MRAHRKNQNLQKKRPHGERVVTLNASLVHYTTSKSGGSERSVTLMVLLERGVSLFDCMDSIQSGIFMVRQHIAICRAVHTVPCSGINGQCMPPQLQRCMHQRHTPGLSTEQEQHGHTRQQIGVLRPLRPSDLVTRMAGSK